MLFIQWSFGFKNAGFEMQASMDYSVVLRNNGLLAFKWKRRQHLKVTGKGRSFQRNDKFLFKRVSYG